MENRDVRVKVTLDGNEAAAYVAFKLNEIIAIYPITPSSPMGEFSDEWSSQGKKNLWGAVPEVIEMQSEGGASGALHGALQAGALATTFTSSQGLLLMIPNMYKIAGELTPAVIHVAARTVATHALSIFGDHSDVMAVRATGFGLLASNSVQEVMDFALIAQAAALETRIPFVHFFDGFRTSHEVMKIEQVSDEVMRKMINEDRIREHRQRALSPDHPVLRGSAQGPDVFFQAREAVNPFYAACPQKVQELMDRFASLTGRSYKLFEYAGARDAERIIVVMGSGAETVQKTVEHLVANGEKVGVIKVRLYRPFAVESFLSAIPPTVRSIAVLDRTKEPGSTGEPLLLDVTSAIAQSISSGSSSWVHYPEVVGGRYGLSSKEFTPAMVKGIFDELKAEKPRRNFTVGIDDDISKSSLPFDPAYTIETEGEFSGVFYGLGSDGTVGANKSSIKIIGDATDFSAQGYFVYDSKKSGSATISHLRFGPKPIHSPFLVEKANFVACHQWYLLERFDPLTIAADNGVFLLNSLYEADEVWDKLPRRIQEAIINKKLKFYVIDAYKVATLTGMGGRINTIMQTCFFAISGVLPRELAIEAIKNSIKKTYSRKGEDVVRRNFEAVDGTLENLHQVNVPNKVTASEENVQSSFVEMPEFVRATTMPMIAGFGDALPVSAMPIDGTFPTDTAKYEKRNIALEIPVWDEGLCIQCNKCVIVCPHSAIRVKTYRPELLVNAPATFKSMDYNGSEYKGMKYTIQVAPEDCTGCNLCEEVCPARSKTDKSHKSLDMKPQPPLREQEKINFDFFLNLPEPDRRTAAISTVKGSQFLQPLFEFSGACSGCGETPYVRLMSQLFGDRAVIANATGCSSIYGGNLPTTPWTTDREGRGPAWANSLFEDNAEFGLGMRLTIDKQTQIAADLVRGLSGQIGEELAIELTNAKQTNEAEIYEQRLRVKSLKEKLETINTPEAKRLLTIADNLNKRSVWIVGGDGWAYDIGYGGLDHVLASGRNVNILVLDSEVYSNTGVQMSKSTPRAAVAKFAASGKRSAKKELGRLAMTYGNVYVASVALGANDLQTLKAFLEAEAYDGPSIIIAYSHCIAHGIDDIGTGMTNQKVAVETGYWPLFRYNPALAGTDKNPFSLDSKPPKRPLKDFMDMETRFKSLDVSHPDRVAALNNLAQQDVTERWKILEELKQNEEPHKQ